jgi:hypothetical protein
MDESEIAVYATAIRFSPASCRTNSSQARRSSARCLSERPVSEVPSTQMRALAGSVGVRPRAARHTLARSREIPRGSSTPSTTFYQELGAAGKFRLELRWPVVRLARAYPRRYPSLKCAGIQRNPVDSKKAVSSGACSSLWLSAVLSGHRWRRGWDSNPRAGITRPSDFESAPL